MLRLRCISQNSCFNNYDPPLFLRFCDPYPKPLLAFSHHSSLTMAHRIRHFNCCDFAGQVRDPYPSLATNSTEFTSSAVTAFSPSY
ncbi:hypothetical protein I7I48_10971 [Histoplasma ohiense]|nr:hypothetical protein I7I48_10971 [Histoplasma ohiense (nom. inval.)]